MQKITGIRSLLSHPFIYTNFQRLLGADSGWKSFVNENVRPKEGNSLLDIGCGPADILDYLPDIDYWGFDTNEAYIEKAKKKYCSQGRFHAKHLSFEDLKMMPKFDLVIACGLLHHLDDAQANHMMKLAYEGLKPNGRMITIDPCYVYGQNLIARFLISKDRGQNVKDQAGYQHLAVDVFSKIKIHIKNKSWIPYTHCIMECSK